MSATDPLVQEHRIIKSVLQCLTRVADAIRETGAVDETSVRQCVRFLRGFADQMHHQKEEECLFPALEKQGILREGGPVGVMLEEHRLGRNLVQGMESELEATAGGDHEAPSRLEDKARAFVQLLTDHIEKEDTVLFELANRVLEPEDHRRIRECYRTPGDAQALLDLARDLCHRHGVAAPPDLPSA